jgi:hypothetical protein
MNLRRSLLCYTVSSILAIARSIVGWDEKPRKLIYFFKGSKYGSFLAERKIAYVQFFLSPSLRYKFSERDNSELGVSCDSGP